MSPKTMTYRGGKWPSHSKAPKAGVHMSSKPCGVRDNAKKNFKRESPVKWLYIDVSGTWFILSAATCADSRDIRSQSQPGQAGIEYWRLKNSPTAQINNFPKPNVIRHNQNYKENRRVPYSFIWHSLSHSGQADFISEVNFAIHSPHSISKFGTCPYLSFISPSDSTVDPLQPHCGQAVWTV